MHEIGPLPEWVRHASNHFWPYGLNYTSEVSSDEDLIRHCLIVGAVQADFAP